MLDITDNMKVWQTRKFLEMPLVPLILLGMWLYAFLTKFLKILAPIISIKEPMKTNKKATEVSVGLRECQVISVYWQRLLICLLIVFTKYVFGKLIKSN
jgi:hypothetical protein